MAHSSFFLILVESNLTASTNLIYLNLNTDTILALWIVTSTNMGPVN